MIRALCVTALALSFMSNPAAAQSLTDRIRHVQQRRAQDARQQHSEQHAQALTLRQRLARPMAQVDLRDVSLERALAQWSREADVPLLIDFEAMALEGVDRGAPVSLQLRRVPAGQILALMLRQATPDDVELIVEPTPWYVEVLTRPQADARMIVRMYSVMDVLHEAPQFDNVPRFDLESVLEQGGSDSGGGSGGSIFGDEPEAAEIMSRQERAVLLMDMIRDTVEPGIWESGGGEASMRYFHGHLIVRAPMYVHRQIGLPVTLRPRSAAPAIDRARPASHRANVHSPQRQASDTHRGGNLHHQPVSGRD